MFNSYCVFLDLILKIVIQCYTPSNVAAHPIFPPAVGTAIVRYVTVRFCTASPSPVLEQRRLRREEIEKGTPWKLQLFEHGASDATCE